MLVGANNSGKTTIYKILINALKELRLDVIYNKYKNNKD